MQGEIFYLWWRNIGLIDFFFSACLDQRLLYVKIMLCSEALYMTKVVDLVFKGLNAAKKFSVNIDMLGAIHGVKQFY